MVLEPIDIANGILALIFVSVSILVGITFFSKYKKSKDKNLILVGITWIIMCEPWWGHSISFLLAILTGDGLNVQIFYFLATTFVPIGLTAWLAAFTEFLYKNKKKQILIVAIVGQAIFEVVFLYVLFTNPSMIAEMRSPVDAETKSFVLVYFLIVLVIFLITGIMFALRAMRSEKPETRLKGKVLLLAILSYVIGAVLDGVIATELFLLLISRIILASSAIEFYYGFVLPNWIKKKFIKNID